MAKPYNKQTILRDGSGPEVGDLAEWEFADWLRKRGLFFLWRGPEKTQFDYVTRNAKRTGSALTIDVKAKDRPRGHSRKYDAHVTWDQRNYEVDIYVFYSVHTSDDLPVFASDARCMGWIRKEDFWKQARWVHKGDKETTPSGRVFIERAAAGKLTYDQLRSMAELEVLLEGLESD